MTSQTKAHAKRGTILTALMRREVTMTKTSDPLELACRKAADDLHALLLRALYARTRGDSNSIRELLYGDDCLIYRQTVALNEAFNAAGLGDPFTI
jgi:hypothetical protein